jgi:uncharacterized protein YkwD
VLRALAPLVLAPVAAVAVGLAPAAAATSTASSASSASSASGASSASRASSTGGDEAAFVAKTNATRQAHGLRPYAVAADLVAVARRQSARMAAQQRLYHNPNLASDVQHWQTAGENVGMGGDVDSVQQAFLNSPAHRANILARDFTEVGVGVVRDGRGALWVTAVFRLPERAPRASRSVPRATVRPTARRAPARPAAPARPMAQPVPRRLRLPAAPPANAGSLARAVAFWRVMNALAR